MVAFLAVAVVIALVMSPAPTERVNHAAVTVEVLPVATTVVAGTPLRATVIIVNRTRHTIAIYGCPNAQVLVGIANSLVAFDPPIALNLCIHVGHLTPGVHRQRFMILTTYYGCGGGFPPCVNGAPPVLPTGTYETKMLLFGFPRGTAVINPVAVTVVAPRA